VVGLVVACEVIMRVDRIGNRASSITSVFFCTLPIFRILVSVLGGYVLTVIPPSENF